MVLIQLHGFHQPSSNMEKNISSHLWIASCRQKDLKGLLQPTRSIRGCSTYWRASGTMFFDASFMQCKKLSTSSCRSLWKYHHYGLSNQSSVNLLEPKCAIGSLSPYLTCKIEWKHDPTAMECPEGSSELWMKKTSPCTSWPEQESRNNGIKTHKKKQPHNQQKLAIHRK